MANLALQLLEEEEGISSHAYLCRGLLHIGMGCLVDPSVPSDGLCQAAIDAQSFHDMEEATALAALLPGYFQCNDVRKAVLISMCFQIGDVAAWPNFRAALARTDYPGAAAAGMDSKWAREDSPLRAKREMQMLASGQWVEKSE